MGLKDSFIQGVSTGVQIGARQALQPNASDRVYQSGVGAQMLDNIRLKGADSNLSVIAMSYQNNMHIQYQQEFYSKLRQGVLDLDLMMRMMDMQQQQPVNQIYIVNVAPSNRIQFDKDCFAKIMQQQINNTLQPKEAQFKALGADGAELEGIEAEETVSEGPQKSGKRLAMEREAGYLAESIEFERNKMMENDGLAMA